MTAPLLAFLIAIGAPLDRDELDRAASAFEATHPGARLVRAAPGGLEHASGLSVARLAADDEANARAFLVSEGRAFGVSSSAELRTRRVWGSPGRAGTAFFERTVSGLPVFGGGIAVGWDRDGVITVVNGARVLAAEPRGGFAVGEDDAIAAALAALPGPRERAAALRGWLQYEGALEPAFRVEHEGASPAAAFLSYVHGGTGELLYRVPRTRRAVPLAGCGPCATPPCICAFPDSPIAPLPPAGSLANAPEMLPARELDPPGDRLKGRRTAAFTCSGRDASPDECVAQSAAPLDGSFAAPPDSTLRRADDAFAEQSAYFHIDDHSRFLDSLDDGCVAGSAPAGTCFAARTPAGGIGFVPAFVNALSSGGPVDNAFFSPAGGPPGSAGIMVFGQGSLVDVSYDAQVVYHELTHAAVDVTAGFEELVDRFGANSDPGALNEGTADTFTVAHTAARLSAGGRVAEAACISSLFAAELGRACLREAANVRTCRGNGPNDGRNPGRDGEVHDDGEIWTGFTWALLEAAYAHGVGAEVARAMFQALQAVGSHPTFHGYAATVRQRMADGALPQAALDFADCTIAQRDLPGCADRAVALFSGERAQAGFFGPTGAGGITTAGQQYFVDVPCGATALHLQTGDTTGEGRLYVRHGRPVEFAGAGLREPRYDWLVPSNRREVVLDGAGCATCACSGDRAPFQAGRWYLLPSGRSTDAGGGVNVFELGVRLAVPDGVRAPERIAFTIGRSGSESDPNVCTWGVTGSAPARAIAAVPTAAPVVACATADGPAPACLETGPSAGRGGCGCGAGTAEGASLALAAWLAARVRSRTRARPGPV
jgi:hypothetical protein